MTSNLILLFITSLSAIFSIIVYMADLQKKVKFPIVTILLALTSTSLILLVYYKTENSKVNMKKESEESTPVLHTSEFNDTSSKQLTNIKKVKSQNIDSLQIHSANIFYTDFYEARIIFLRNRLLTNDELNICNQCLTYTAFSPAEVFKEGEFISNNRNIYKNPELDICKRKKNIDDKTGIGYISTGALVQLIESKGSFSHIRLLSNGIEGWIVSKLYGKPTIVNPINNVLPSGYKLQQKPR